jgi:DNA-binding transcriptional regulator GbsR (MarR family)
MNNELLTYADRVGRFYTRQYGFPPMAGRLLGYLAVCDPARQPINTVAETLMASRSAIIEAVKVLEAYHLVERTRAAGERSDHIALDPKGLETNGFSPAMYTEQETLAREGLALLRDASPERRAILEETAAMTEFLAERMPQVLDEWHTKRDAMRAASEKRQS